MRKVEVRKELAVVLDEEGGDLGVVAVDGDLRGEDAGADDVGAEDDAEVLCVHEGDGGVGGGEGGEELEEELEDRLVVHGQAREQLLEAGDPLGARLLVRLGERRVGVEGEDGLRQVREELLENARRRVGLRDDRGDIHSLVRVREGLLQLLRLRHHRALPEDALHHPVLGQVVDALQHDQRDGGRRRLVQRLEGLPKDRGDRVALLQKEIQELVVRLLHFACLPVVPSSSIRSKGPFETTSSTSSTQP